jgi:hypothetical protein
MVVARRGLEPHSLHPIRAPAYKYSLFLYILVMTVEFSLPRLSDWQNHDVQRACSHSADCQDCQQTDSIRLRLSGVRISCSERKFSSEFRRFVTEFWKFSSEFSIRTANTELHMANSKTCMAIHILHFTSYISHHHPVSLLSVLSPPKMTANPDVQGVLSVWQSQTHFFLYFLKKQKKIMIIA